MFGYTAVEAMALGKPVLCFIRDMAKVRDASACPIINTNPDNLYDKLKYLAENRDEIPRLGQASRAYVEKHHSIEAFCHRLNALYVDNPFPGTYKWVSQRAAAPFIRTRHLCRALYVDSHNGFQKSRVIVQNLRNQCTGYLQRNMSPRIVAHASTARSFMRRMWTLSGAAMADSADGFYKSRQQARLYLRISILCLHVDRHTDMCSRARDDLHAVAVLSAAELLGRHADTDAAIAC
jgi:hypothetical protein